MTSMSEKDAVSSQDIPALVRALGTLALAAATAVAIKWFISYDTKEENTECNKADLENNPCSKVQEQTTSDGCLLLDGIPLKNTNPSEVSDGGRKKLDLLLEGCHDFVYYRSPAETSCTISEQENGQQINLSCGFSPKEANQISTTACKLNMVVTSPANSTLCIQTEDDCNASVLTARTSSNATNALEDQIFSDCLTHRYHGLPLERTASIQKPECSFGTGSRYGEYIDDLNTRCSRCQNKVIAESFIQHSTVSIGVSEDILIIGLNEKNGVLNSHSEINLINSATSPENQKYNIDNLVIDNINEDNTSVNSVGNSVREKVDVICNIFACETEMSIGTNACSPNYPSCTDISENTTQCSVNSAVENDNLHCTEVLSNVEKAISTTHENVVSAGDICTDIKQCVTLHSRMDSQGINTYQSNVGEKLTVNAGKVTEIPNDDLKHSIQHTVQNINDDDNSTGNMVPSLENVFHNEECNNFQQYVTSIDTYTVRNEAQEIFQGSSHCGAIHPMEENMTDNTHCYSNNTKELLLSEEWRSTTNYTEHIVLEYPLDLVEPKQSINSQGKQSEMSAVLKNKGISMDLSTNLITENSHKEIEVNKESVRLFCTTSNAAHAMTTFENTMNDSASLGTVTEAEDVSSVKSINYGKDNSESQNWQTRTGEHQEGSNVITNGYLDINHEVTDKNNILSKITKNQEHCRRALMSVPCEPCSSLMNDAFPTADSSLENTYFCKDSNFTLRAMVGTYTAQIGQHNANDNYDIFPEINKDRDKQISSVGDTFSSCIKPLAKDKQNGPMYCDSNLSPTQNMCLTYNNVTNLCNEERDDVTHAREKIMSTIAENPELILPEYQSKFKLVKKRPLITKSCDNILSGHSYQESTLKTKAQSMLCLLTEYYSSKLPSDNGPVEEVARGSFICIPKGLQSAGEALRFQLTLGNCLELLKLARKNRVQELLKAVYTVISDNYLNVLKNSAVYGQLTGLERERILQLRTRGKLSLCVVETKSIFGLNKNIRCPVEIAEHKAQLYSLDIKTNKWKPVTRIPAEACLKGCSICSMHNYLFIAGGLQETSEGLMCSNKLYCYNPLTDIWTQLTPMNEGRSQLKLIPLDGYLYAIGGECLHTVEKYDPRLNKWTFVAPLPKGTFAVAHEAAACGGEIYISGGHLFYRLLKYSPVHDQWEECPFNASKGRSCDMVAVGSILYRFDMHKDSSVNILKYNTLAKMWSEYTATFPATKIPFRCALLEGNIYCINRETTAKFSLEYEKAVFEAGVFSKVPQSGGSPHPTVLCLHGSVSQTSV
ncbi:uncharacterized protein ACMZJ9_016307 [Mantella aurantiaca]